MIEVAKYLRPWLREIVVMGDYLDFYCVSSHKKDASIKVDFKAEIEDGNAGLDELDKNFPDAKKTFIEGNHENRLERYINEKCPEMFGIFDWQDRLKLNERPNWKVVPYRPDQAHQILGSSLKVRHEPHPQSGNISQVLAKMMTSVAFGHIHRILEGYAVSLDGDQYVAFCPGWLGNKHNPVFRYVKGYWQWQLGFAIVWVDPHTKLFYHQKIAILPDYSCMVDGMRFKAA